MKGNSPLTPRSSQDYDVPIVLYQQGLNGTGQFTNVLRSDHFAHKEVVKIRIL